MKKGRTMKLGDIRRPPVNLVEGFKNLATSTVANALEDLGVDGVLPEIKSIAPGLCCVGPAVTVSETTGAKGTFPPEDFRIGHMIEAAAAGDVIVVDNGGHRVSTWGGMASYAAHLKGIAGLVVDGAVRDLEEIVEFSFPVFARHLTPTTGKTRLRVEAINIPVTVDGIAVSPGDIIVGDGTGIVRVPADKAAETLALAQAFARDDGQAMEEMRDGLSFKEALGKFAKI
jgi:regulator of RNase E activity RraA